jgi:hexosaminidase
VFVVDAPRFPYRGLLVDSARHFLPVSQLLHTIDSLAQNHLNVLHWHIVDSSAFPCGSATFPALAAAGAYDPSAVYSVADLRAVVAYGKARGVRVLPEWDVPGHGKWGGVPGVMGCADVLDPTADATYAMLGAFLGEMGAIFEEPWLFLGGDEVDSSCWDRNPAIAAWLAAHNMTSSELQQYFWVQMRARVLPALGKTVGVWEADSIQIDLSSLAAGSFVNVRLHAAPPPPFVSPQRAAAPSLSQPPIPFSMRAPAAGRPEFRDGEKDHRRQQNDRREHRRRLVVS